MSRGVVLASASPRRSELLNRAGIPFDICVSDVDENIDIADPCRLVEELSYRKAKRVFDDGHRNSTVIGADTLVYAQGEILGKPVDREHCRVMLNMLSGSDHHVYTGVSVIWTDEHGMEQSVSFHEDTRVHVTKLSDREIEDYIATGEPMDKAGAYGIQGTFAKFIMGIEGDYNNVVGLPVARLYTVLKEHELI
ncbi:MAG: Maf family protein [Lachnospiraceae bacterium]|nr:Maf family protein [Lachnospiraceae bacterium]